MGLEGRGRGGREVLPQRWRGGSLPAGFEGGGCEGGELGCDGEDAVEFPVGAGSRYGSGDAGEDSVTGSVIVGCLLIARCERVPRFAQAYVCDAIVVAEGYVEGAVGVEGAAIEADVLVESLEEEGAVIDGGFWFARHSVPSQVEFARWRWMDIR